LSILWRKQSRLAVIASAYLGLLTGLAVWIGTAHRYYGSVTVSSTGQTLPCMYGTIASAFSPALYSVLITLFAPENFDWTSLGKVSLAVAAVDGIDEDHDRSCTDTDVRKNSRITQTNEARDDASDVIQRRWSRYALFWAIATFLGHWVLWPLPMYAAKFEFSKGVSHFRVKKMIIC
jgi:hypothetical protein